jgi:SAM-dependent methyltransferase
MACIFQEIHVMRSKTTPDNLLERIGIAINSVPTPLIDTQVAFNTARAIMAAAELGIFEALGKSKKDGEQIVAICKTDPKATIQLLDCLVGIEYVDWIEEKYSLRSKYYKWLLKEYPSNIIEKLRFQRIEWNWMSHLEDYINTGKSLDLHSILSPDEWVHYQDAMRDISVNASKKLAKKISLSPEQSKMLDIGGSHGLYSVELCKRYPSLQSIILELPGAIDEASKIASQYGITDRVKYRAGNALKDDLGENEFDLIMINNLVHHFTDGENRILAHKVYRALKPGGIYAIGEFVRQQKPGGGGGVAAALGLYFSLISSSGAWSLEEIRSWQEEAGLKIGEEISLITLPGWKMSIARK